MVACVLQELCGVELRVWRGTACPLTSGISPSLNTADRIAEGRKGDVPIKIMSSLELNVA